ncbi:(2Fe-2S)-binding protein [Pimelobacter simplex]|uniref:2Fe-2S iron-sulfur cluster binding domain-containing protein n=1 Tax=Nocardioides simplex TaxID=2045 RepID=A0A0A1DF70_NOCSI|nr:2Fe-2S iron-sulfur cluster-binding protein [Pimelobacter simplex]AIY15886.1 Periplasmic aromatic aldehyde oxidoreductase, iron-sulfur subunit YagT [Pimelobacter simplex]KAB2807958.1 2Fe-2S iron-sulfur cluster binding domain-containing protein [Pimelobacter simplex]MCG8154498.1 2Fe-2S iron-sulfur cluster binding domain-containing protein [Pimelobacter simplex]SFM93469.1 carbon-monoxide dehydrogenase small subunit/xanthine dehydrogenase YagT iron-sulfur-binding subunit [Pimelobacter simplex]G
MQRLRINGEQVAVEVRGAESLAAVLRDRVGLTGTKIACERGECGACTVLVEGRPTMSCIQPAALVAGEVETIEGLADEIRDLREEFADRGAFQCGFCTPGQLVRAAALLREEAARAGLDPDVVRHQMSGNICRCTGYQAIVAAVVDVAERRAGADA